MKKSTFLVALLVIVGTFYVVWHLKSNSAVASAAPEAGDTVIAVDRTRAIADPPLASPEASQLYKEALDTLSAGDTEGAKSAFRDLMQRFPSRVEGARSAVALASIFTKDGNLYKARNSLSGALTGLPEGPERQTVVAELNKLNGELVFSRKEAPDSLTYTVKAGDSLYVIGKRFHITPAFIKRLNYLTSDDIFPDDRLKVFQGPFDMLIEKSKFRLTLSRSGIFIKEYPIGLGEDGSTPDGEFTVTNKVVDAEWDPPGPEFAASGAPDNPLGSRWIEFAPHYGVHGTIDPDSIGTEQSRGCVRMFNADVEEIYDILVNGSKVTIEP